MCSPAGFFISSPLSDTWQGDGGGKDQVFVSSCLREEEEERDEVAHCARKERQGVLLLHY